MDQELVNLLKAGLDDSQIKRYLKLCEEGSPPPPPEEASPPPAQLALLETNGTPDRRLRESITDVAHDILGNGILEGAPSGTRWYVDMARLQAANRYCRKGKVRTPQACQEAFASALGRIKQRHLALLSLVTREDKLWLKVKRV